MTSANAGPTPSAGRTGAPRNALGVLSNRCLPWNKRQRERSDRRRLVHGRSVWLGRRRCRRAAAAKRRPGYGALPWNKRQRERSDRRRLVHGRSVWLGRRRCRRAAAAKRRPGYGALPWNKRQRERSDRRRLVHARSVWLGRRRCRRAAAAKRRPGYGALPWNDQPFDRQCYFQGTTLGALLDCRRPASSSCYRLCQGLPVVIVGHGQITAIRGQLGQFDKRLRTTLNLRTPLKVALRLRGVGIGERKAR